MALRIIGAVIIVALLFGGTPLTSHAQDTGERPRTPAVSTTTQVNPRGTDVVEPMWVYRVTLRRGADPDTTYLGVAKIPDPRLGEEGAFVSADRNTGTLIRISDAWIIGQGGLRRLVEFDPRAAADRLVFRPGPHDKVISRQGVEAVRSAPGREVVFDIADLYAAARVNPLTGTAVSEDDGSPRSALLKMVSTYPGGEAVSLSINLVPREQPVTV
ncbi:MAG: hypothetical protein ACOCTG_04635, partial [Bacteroidota bacterium]